MNNRSLFDLEEQDSFFSKYSFWFYGTFTLAALAVVLYIFIKKCSSSTNPLGPYRPGPTILDNIIRNGDILLEYNANTRIHKIIECGNKFHKYCCKKRGLNTEIVHAAICVEQKDEKYIVESSGEGLTRRLLSEDKHDWEVFRFSKGEEKEGKENPVVEAASDFANSLALDSESDRAEGQKHPSGQYDRIKAALSALRDNPQTSASKVEIIDNLLKECDFKAAKYYCSNFVVLVYALASALEMHDQRFALNLDYRRILPAVLHEFLQKSRDWKHIGYLKHHFTLYPSVSRTSGERDAKEKLDDSSALPQAASSSSSSGGFGASLATFNSTLPRSSASSSPHAQQNDPTKLEVITLKTDRLTANKKGKISISAAVCKVRNVPANLSEMQHAMLLDKTHKLCEDKNVSVIAAVPKNSNELVIDGSNEELEVDAAVYDIGYAYSSQQTLSQEAHREVVATKALLTAGTFCPVSSSSMAAIGTYVTGEAIQPSGSNGKPLVANANVVATETGSSSSSCGVTGRQPYT